MPIRKVPKGWWQSAIEWIKTPVACVNMDNQFVWVNAAFERLVGYTVHELEGKTWMSITKPDDVGLDLACVEDVIEGKRRDYFCDKTYIHKNGNDVPIELGACRFPEMGDLSCFIVQAISTSDGIENPAMITALQEDHKAKHEQLVDTIKILSTELQEMRRRQDEDEAARAANDAIVAFLQKWWTIGAALIGALIWIVNLLVKAGGE